MKGMQAGMQAGAQRRLTSKAAPASGPHAHSSAGALSAGGGDAACGTAATSNNSATSGKYAARPCMLGARQKGQPGEQGGSAGKSGAVGLVSDVGGEKIDTFGDIYVVRLF